ncbi:MAG TPA: DUF2177 family protein [Candidatus Limnocylindrales bacterium]|nr:DUF2177 family protein [Candidatus Limnocylindrales bacterium]
MKKILTITVIVFVAMFILNFIVFRTLGIFNHEMLEGIISGPESRNFSLLAINYFLLSLGFTYLILKLNRDKDYGKSATIGFVAGMLLFINYGLSNMFILPAWPVFVAVTDAIGTGVVFALLGPLVTLLQKKFNVKS